MANAEKKYNSLDGLRTMACLGIVLMHMSTNNEQYEISGFIYNIVIPSFTNFVFLFMVLSAFGMGCGYYTRVLSNKLDFTDFYRRRYMKILPFFFCLIVLDLIVSYSKASVYEAIANLSLTFGLFPNEIEVIGVGWFLGLVFAFYMIFPFYCVLIGTKRRAWLSFAISLILNYICAEYFDVGRNNIVYSLCFFIVGGLIFLYKDSIEQIKWYISLIILVISIIIYYIVGGVYSCLFVSTMFVIFALGKGGIIFDNRFARFISRISLEMYLSHMAIFRVIEKLHLNTRFGKGVLQYIITCILVIGIDVVFAFVAQKFLALCGTRINDYCKNTCSKYCK